MTVNWIQKIQENYNTWSVSIYHNLQVLTLKIQSNSPITKFLKFDSMFSVVWIDVEYHLIIFNIYFVHKILNKLWRGSNFLRLINGIYKNSRTGITFSGKTLYILLLRPKSRQGYFHSIVYWRFQPMK